MEQVPLSDARRLFRYSDITDADGAAALYELLMEAGLSGGQSPPGKPASVPWSTTPGRSSRSQVLFCPLKGTDAELRVWPVPPAQSWNAASSFCGFTTCFPECCSSYSIHSVGVDSPLHSLTPPVSLSLSHQQKGWSSSLRPMDRHGKVGCSFYCTSSMTDSSSSSGVCPAASVCLLSLIFNKVPSP